MYLTFPNCIKDNGDDATKNYFVLVCMLSMSVLSKDNVFVVGCGGMDWIELAQDRDRWRAPVSAVMNLRVP
jgi:hypothetical protein